MLTGVLASPSFLGFLEVSGACPKSPMISRRKVNIIQHYQTQHARVRRAGGCSCIVATRIHSLCSGEETGGQKDGGEEAEAFEVF